MSKFDNTINSLLNNLIFEESEIDPQQVIDETREAIKKELETNPNYEIESQERYENDLGTFQKVEEFFNKFSKLDENISWEDIKSAGKSVFDKIKEYGAPAIETVGDYAVENIGDFVKDVIGEENVNYINDNLSERLWYQIASVFDPTGVMSWPYYKTALEAYDQHKGTEDEDIYFLNLLAAQISVIPGVRLPIGIITLPFRLIGKVPLFFTRGLARFMRRLFSSNKSTTKASSKLSKVSIGTKATQTVKNAAKAVTAITGKAAKIGAVGAKVATSAGEGDIPKKVKEWQNVANDIIDSGKSKKGTLGLFPKFNEISTQSF